MATAAPTKPRKAAKPAAATDTSAPAPTSNLTGRVAQVIGAVVDQIIPARAPQAPEPGSAPASLAAVEYEPDEEDIFTDLLPRNIAIQVYRALLENQAGFYGSQMTAMDNATRNAGDMINKLSIQYNRQRQAVITTELIEIISGAEAL